MGKSVRKWVVAVVVLLALAGAGAALAGPVATDSQGFFIVLNVRVSPPVAGTARIPRGVGFSADSFTGNRIDGNRIADYKSFVIRFGRGFEENGQFFPACKVDPTGVSKCTAVARIGWGTAEASVPGSGGAPPRFLTAPLRVYNGSSFRGHRTLIVQALLNGKPSLEEDYSLIQSRSGPWGPQLALIVDSPSTGAAITSTHFTLPDRVKVRNVNGRRRVIHLIQAPTSCSGTWRFQEAATFRNAGPLTVTDAQPCVAR
jgi:hypothetical protein